MMSKQFRLLTLVAMILLLLAACAPAPTATDAPDDEPVENDNEAEETGGEEEEVATEPAEEEETGGEEEESGEAAEVSIWFMPNGASPDEHLQVEIDAFNAENPNITIVPEQVGWGDAYGRIQTAVQGGEGPCLTQLGT